MMDNNITVIASVFDANRFNLENEKVLQDQIEKELIDFKIPYEREVDLDNNGKNIIDFVVFGDIGIEIKIKGTRMNIFRQCSRYCGSDRIKQLVLVTSKCVYLPEMVMSKPAHEISLSKFWL